MHKVVGVPPRVIKSVSLPGCDSSGAVQFASPKRAVRVLCAEIFASLKTKRRACPICGQTTRYVHKSVGFCAVFVQVRCSLNLWDRAIPIFQVKKQTKQVGQRCWQVSVHFLFNLVLHCFGLGSAIYFS